MSSAARVDGPPEVDAALREALTELGTRRPLLVGLDFDGVLAPIVDRPGDARALPGTMEAVAEIAALPDVAVALVSGRALADLSERTGVRPDGDVQFVCSHGAEVGPTPAALGGPGSESEGPSDGGATTTLDEAARERLARVQARLESVAAEHPPAHVETKPAAAVLHTRGLPAAESAAVTAQALALLAEVEDVHVTRGKEVVDVSVVETSKGHALGRLRDAGGAERSVLYLGDDVTDETVFGTLRPGDVGIKVGNGDTAATHRIADPAAVRALLQWLPTLLAHP